MLIRFEIENFRSVREPVELSMVAVDSPRPGTSFFDNLNESLVRVAALYGPNASGKSNVLLALKWLVDAVRNSLRFWDDEIPVQPFAFAGLSELSDTSLTVELVVGGVRFEYRVELNSRAVTYEGLFHYPERKRRRVFERVDDDLRLQRGLGSVSGVRDLLTPRVLVLSIARRFDEPVISDFARELLLLQGRGLRRRSVGTPRLGIGRVVGRTARLFERDDDELTLFPERDDEAMSDRTRAIELLRMADLGIEDVVFREEGGRRVLQLLHQTESGPAALDMDQESDGTVTWFDAIAPVLAALRRGTMLLFDELDASLHPTLSAELVRLFADEHSNPHGAQLVFSSHDTSLLDHLHRDEVWLTEKDARGATSLTALAEFAGDRVEQSRDLERGYLSGRFGGLPAIDRVHLFRALGLIG